MIKSRKNKQLYNNRTRRVCTLQECETERLVTRKNKTKKGSRWRKNKLSIRGTQHLAYSAMKDSKRGEKSTKWLCISYKGTNSRRKNRSQEEFLLLLVRPNSPKHYHTGLSSFSSSSFFFNYRDNIAQKGLLFDRSLILSKRNQNKESSYHFALTRYFRLIEYEILSSDEAHSIERKEQDWWGDDAIVYARIVVVSWLRRSRVEPTQRVPCTTGK